ncbi:MAG: phosphoenolpyruvate carboxylase [Nitrososphaeria archaeon]
MRKIPRTMATQHPDNANVPDWVKGKGSIEGDDEVYEAYLAYSFYGVEEVMWDAEGKDVDTHVARKLFTMYPEYFKDNVLGKHIFLTYRVPNPFIEGVDRKVFAETLESIPINHDVGEKFYGEAVTVPVFEAILPFTTHPEQLIALAKYYEKAVINKENMQLTENLKVRDLIGEIKPKWLEVIPLVEDKDSLLSIKSIIEKYVNSIKVSYLRVFIARSDPAMNYGIVSAVLLAKHALSELKKVEELYNIPIYPIIGVGSLPFRGHLNPLNVENVFNEYRGVWTFTVQSAFRYDYKEEETRSAIRFLNISKPYEKESFSADELNTFKKIIDTYTPVYQTVIEGLAPLINEIAGFVPRRRARKLHIGLFGYSRNAGKITLPRAITFVSTLYSLGLPPEIFGASALDKLNEEEWNMLISTYRFLDIDLKASIDYFSDENLKILKDKMVVNEKIIQQIKNDISFIESNFGIKKLGEKYDVLKHRLLSTLTLAALLENNREEIVKNITEMARLRKSLG